MIKFNRPAFAPLCISTALLVSLPLKSFAFAEFERGAVTLETDANVTYDSFFIGATKLGDDDYYVTLHPELKYDRKAGLAEISGYAGVSFVRYDTYKQYNTNDIDVGFKTQLPVAEGSRLSGNFDISYTEANVVDQEVLARIHTKTFAIDGDFRYALGLKTSLEDVISYSDVERDLDYSNQKTFSNTLSYIYADFFYDTSLTLSYGYVRTTSSGQNYLLTDLDQRTNSVSAGLSRPLFGPVIGSVTYGYHVLDRDAQENLIGQRRISGGFFSINLHGPFLPPSKFPKLQSSASITYQNAISPGINDFGGKTVTGDISLSWQARPRTEVSIHGARSIDLSATDLSVTDSRVSFDVRQSVGYQISLTGEIAYTWRDYRNLGRHDGTWQTSLSGTYMFNKYWSAGGTYMYQDNRTNVTGLNPVLAFRMQAYNYDRNVVTLFVKNEF